MILTQCLCDTLLHETQHHIHVFIIENYVLWLSHPTLKSKKIDATLTEEIGSFTQKYITITRTDFDKTS